MDNYKSGRQPERKGVSILTNHGCLNGRFVSQKVKYRWITWLSSRLPDSRYDKSTMDNMCTNSVLSTLLVVYAACLTPHSLPAWLRIVCSVVVEHQGGFSSKGIFPF